MRRSFLALFFLLIWVALTISVLLTGFMFNWPDNVHTNYGIPLVWATHTSSTFVGPVDNWIVDLTALLIDLLFWLGIMVAAVTVILLFPKQKLSQI